MARLFQMNPSSFSSSSKGQVWENRDPMLGWLASCLFIQKRILLSATGFSDSTHSFNSFIRNFFNRFSLLSTCSSLPGCLIWFPMCSNKTLSSFILRQRTLKWNFSLSVKIFDCNWKHATDKLSLGHSPSLWSWRLSCKSTHPPPACSADWTFCWPDPSCGFLYEAF